MFPEPPRALGDSQGRFAAVVLYQHHLAVLPALESDQFVLLGLTGTAPYGAGAGPGQHFQQHQQQDEGVAGLGCAAALGNSYILDLSKLGAGREGDLAHPRGRAGRGAGRSILDVSGSGVDASGRGRQSLGLGALGGPGIQEVRDAVLLNGYTEPVLLVLHQPEPTWPGRYRCVRGVVCAGGVGVGDGGGRGPARGSSHEHPARYPPTIPFATPSSWLPPSLLFTPVPRERKDTCALTAISLSVRRKKQAVLWATHGLPSDALALVPVPERPAALLLTPSYILYCQQVRPRGRQSRVLEMPSGVSGCSFVADAS